MYNDCEMYIIFLLSIML